MSTMIELYYTKPEDELPEELIRDRVASFDGEVTHREVTNFPGNICLTIEFPDWERAVHAVRDLRNAGEFEEGRCDY